MTKQSKIKRVKELAAQYNTAKAAKAANYAGAGDGTEARRLNCLMCDIDHEAAQLGMGCNGIYAKFCDMVVSA